MKQVLLLVSLMMSCLFPIGSFAQTQSMGKLQINGYKYSIKAPKAIGENNDFNCMDITSHGGDLAKLLGDNIYIVDSLVVRGTVDDTDFNTLWDAS